MKGNMPFPSKNATLQMVRETGLSVKEIKTWDKIAKGSKGKTVQQIANELGCDRVTVYRRLKKIAESDYIKRQRAKLETLEELNFANAVANILKGNWDTTKDIYRGTGVLTDKLEIIAKRVSDEELIQQIKEAFLKAEVVSVENCNSKENVSRETFQTKSETGEIEEKQGQA
jgi:DNA-binding Lrp family transcriptional regulator